MRESDLYEASYGSNEEFNDGKVKYLPEKKTFAIASEVGNNLYLVVLLYTDGRILFSTTNNPDVFSIVVGSIEQLMNPVNVNKAYSHKDELEKMLEVVISKFYTRIDQLKFVAVTDADLKKLEKFLEHPKMLRYLEMKKFEFVENIKAKGVNLVIFQKQ
jgi:hypothetical protein